MTAAALFSPAFWLTTLGFILAAAGSSLALGTARWPALGFAGYAIALPGWVIIGVVRLAEDQWLLTAAAVAVLLWTMGRLRALSRVPPPRVQVRQHIHVPPGTQGRRP